MHACTYMRWCHETRLRLLMLNSLLCCAKGCRQGGTKLVSMQRDLDVWNCDSMAFVHNPRPHWILFYERRLAGNQSLLDVRGALRRARYLVINLGQRRLSMLQLTVTAMRYFLTSRVLLLLRSNLALALAITAALKCKESLQCTAALLAVAVPCSMLMTGAETWTFLPGIARYALSMSRHV